MEDKRMRKKCSQTNHRVWPLALNLSCREGVVWQRSGRSRWDGDEGGEGGCDDGVAGG